MEARGTTNRTKAVDVVATVDCQMMPPTDPSGSIVLGSENLKDGNAVHYPA
ncbi:MULTISPECIES: hypothetical protein [Rhodococcus]|uniref:hypothetical protein n=1 Tax=Nocardiaceae TaxID=85025 RepID=UPI0007AACE38|nr:MULTISPECIES: hypothetical protein [Rhodococcus]AMY56212.1 hypothetical protein A3L23_04914 [Rhodococcus fascians D188]